MYRNNILPNLEAHHISQRYLWVGTLKRWLMI